ncbi:sulfur oxidation c-type cytochrome SoxX [Candidatus Vondammii sp. HM_W22]|uniref:sulfur oxidation c-type cytochrome SoxX n=1 Tax=Candidatus Vondammii sp. HM_W22 TaxID=2687299 RepID=UPI001F132E71|nr:sulfur oxidation c-type cytochrome SoxX [Candidatus Vondammii sp. HM_W22]
MIKIRKRLVIVAAAFAVLTGCSIVGSSAFAASASDVSEGKKLAFGRTKGNCLACHMIEGGSAHGNIAPPLVAMKARYPAKAKLTAQISDASRMNQETMMPLFGAHAILSEAEIDKIVDFVLSL